MEFQWCFNCKNRLISPNAEPSVFSAMPPKKFLAPSPINLRFCDGLWVVTAFPLFLTSICCMNRNQNIFCNKQFFSYFKRHFCNKVSNQIKTSEWAYPRFFAGDNILFRKYLIPFNKKMLETPLIYYFILTLPSLWLFEAMCLNILLVQYYSWP